MTSYSLSVADLRACTGWGQHRARMITLRPYPLKYTKVSPGPLGGQATRIYRLSDLLMRCRQKTAFTDEMQLQLVQRDQVARNNHQGPSK